MCECLGYSGFFFLVLKLFFLQWMIILALRCFWETRPSTVSTGIAAVLPVAHMQKHISCFCIKKVMKVILTTFRYILVISKNQNVLIGHILPFYELKKYRSLANDTNSWQYFCNIYGILKSILMFIQTIMVKCMKFVDIPFLQSHYIVSLTDFLKFLPLKKSCAF